jgi:hypothetical protein
MAQVLVSSGRRNPLTTHINAGIAALGVKTVRPFHASYEWCMGFLEDRLFRNLASNVHVCRVKPGVVEIQLYNTPIIRYYRNGTFSVDACGFNTPTTRNRINQFTPEGWTFGFNDKQLYGMKRYANGAENLTHKVRLKP